MEAQAEWAAPAEEQPVMEAQAEWTAPAEQQPWMAAEPSENAEPQAEWASSDATQDWNAAPAATPGTDWNASADGQNGWNAPVEEMQPEWATTESSEAPAVAPEWGASAEQQPVMEAAPEEQASAWSSAPAETSWGEPAPEASSWEEQQAGGTQTDWNAPTTENQGEWGASAHDAEPMDSGRDPSLFGTNSAWSAEEPEPEAQPHWSSQEQAPAWGQSDSLATPAEELASAQPPAFDRPTTENDIPIMEAEPEPELPVMEVEPETTEIDLTEDSVEPPAVAAPVIAPPPPPAPVAAAPVARSAPLPVKPPAPPMASRVAAPPPAPAAAVATPRAPATASAAPVTAQVMVPGAPPPRPTLNTLPAVRSSPSASAVMAPVNAFIEGEHRVIIHTVEGQVKRGAIRDVDLLDEVIPLEQQTGFAPERIPVSRVKAIFFMLATGSRPPQSEGQQKVRVTFTDGRQVAGFSDDYTNPGQGFFVIPADMRTNTSRIFIYRASVQAVAEG
ncbi:hypothetical protein Q664_09650 [Archangium violaceum Cb vi76]|uniref:Uncharacterized protein n=2 Tax=Archangium violaceum TaxID=83451 RepID=A0A084SXY7_9BACT|nr:hypothetical protein Q664_09650 [Archangium violaceum Cb vi76]